MSEALRLLLSTVAVCHMVWSGPAEDAFAHFQSGTKLGETGNIPVATNEFRAAIQIGNGFPEAHYFLALTFVGDLLEKLDWPRVASECRAALRAPPDLSGSAAPVPKALFRAKQCLTLSSRPSLKSILLIALAAVPFLASAQSQYTFGQHMRIMSASGKGNFCMGSQKDRGTDGENVFMLPCHDAINQRWTITTAASGGAALIGAGGFCLDVRASSTAAGAPVQLWRCHFQGNQRFIVSNDGTIKEQSSGKCLQAEADKPGAPIVLAACKGVPTEKWHIQE